MIPDQRTRVEQVIAKMRQSFKDAQVNGYLFGIKASQALVWAAELEAALAACGTPQQVNDLAGEAVSIADRLTALKLPSDETLQAVVHDAATMLYDWPAALDSRTPPEAPAPIGSIGWSCSGRRPQAAEAPPPTGGATPAFTPEASAAMYAALKHAHHELNEIRARDGVPWTHLGYESSVDRDYFSSVVDECSAALVLAKAEGSA